MVMAATPVVLVPNGTPVTPANLGTPVTIVSDTATVVKNGDNVQVRLNNNTDGHAATAVVTGGSIIAVKLALTTTAMVDTNDTITGVAPTGTYTNTVRFTVVNGAITGIALS